GVFDGHSHGATAYNARPPRSVLAQYMPLTVPPIEHKHGPFAADMLKTGNRDGLEPILGRLLNLPSNVRPVDDSIDVVHGLELKSASRFRRRFGALKRIRFRFVGQ